MFYIFKQPNALLYCFYRLMCRTHSPRIYYLLQNRLHPTYSDVACDKSSSFITSFLLLGCCGAWNNASYRTWYNLIRNLHRINSKLQLAQIILKVHTQIILIQRNLELVGRPIYNGLKEMHDEFHELGNENTIHICNVVVYPSSNLLRGRRTYEENTQPMSM